jgi:guanylate kinase
MHKFQNKKCIFPIIWGVAHHANITKYNANFIFFKCETDRHLAEWLTKYNQSQRSLIEKRELTQHAYECHQTGWNKAGNLYIENSNQYTKSKEPVTGMPEKPISQPGMHILPAYTLLISKEGSK